MPIPLQRSLRIIAMLLLFGLGAWARDWPGAEAQLASRIASVTGPAPVALEITNRSSLSLAESDEVGRDLRSQMAAFGLRLVNSDQATATVRVSLSEDLQNYVWVAEILRGGAASSVLVVSTPRGGGDPAVRDAGAITIHKALLWVQPERVLDVAVMDGNPTRMAVLDANQLALYRLENGRWQAEQILAITHEHPWPRDLRGRIVLRKDHLLDIYLPGLFCRSTANSPLALNCYASDDPWPLGGAQGNLNAFFAPARNYFTGAFVPGIGTRTSVSPFYSAAALPRDKYTLWVFSGVDGEIHGLDGTTDQTAGKPGWGSDIASVRSACGPDWNILATGGGDRGPDSLRAFSLADREPSTVSQPAEFPGPITALWAEANGDNAVAVSRNAETGEYEAFRLSFTCGQ